jgi:hypothetical protein
VPSQGKSPRDPTPSGLQGAQHPNRGYVRGVGFFPGGVFRHITPNAVMSESSILQVRRRFILNDSIRETYDPQVLTDIVARFDHIELGGLDG